MAETPLPADAGVPLKFLRGQGILTGMDGALNPVAKNAATQAATMYQAMGPDYQERVDALVRADGRVPLMSVHVLYREWKARQSERSSLRDTTDSELA